jgi:glycogen debranching enzyme
MPLLLPDLNRDIVERITTALTGPRFGIDSAAIFGVPSYDRTSAKYDPSRYWRGPTWMNTTWLISSGLRRHGFVELAAKLDGDLLTLAHRSGLREYFNPVTGTGHGTHGFSWSAAMVIHMVRCAD